MLKERAYTYQFLLLAPLQQFNQREEIREWNTVAWAAWNNSVPQPIIRWPFSFSPKFPTPSKSLKPRQLSQCSDMENRLCQRTSAFCYPAEDWSNTKNRVLINWKLNSLKVNIITQKRELERLQSYSKFTCFPMIYTCLHCSCLILLFNWNMKVKWVSNRWFIHLAIPVTGRGGPYGCEML
jgi:hypothetical protein